MASVEEIILKVTAEANLRALKEIDKTLQSVGNLEDGIKKLNDKQLSQLGKQATQVGKATQAFHAKLSGLSQAMTQIGLSMLFFGMALKRLSTSIIKSALTSFNKITYGAEGAGGAMGVLNVHFELLKYTLGAAIDTLLQAFLPTIIEIILAVQDWIEQNPELSAGILLAMAAIGSILVVAGTLLSVLPAIITTFGLFAEGGQLAGLVAGTSLGGVLAVLGWIALAVVLLWAAWKTNFGNIKDMTSKTFKSIQDIITTAFELIWKTFGNLIDIVTGVMEGDWGKVGEAMVRIFGDVSKALIKIMLNLWAIIYNIAAFALNGIKDLLISIWVDLPMTLASNLAEFFGLDTLKDMADNFKNWADGFKSNNGFALPYTSGAELYGGINNIQKSTTGMGMDDIFTQLGNYGREVDTAKKSVTGFTGVIVESNNKVAKSAEALATSGMNAAQVLARLGGDSTTGWTQGQFNLQRAMGSDKQGAIDYRISMGNDILRSIYGDSLRTVTDFKPGVSKIGNYQDALAFANSRGGNPLAPATPGITVINKTQNGGTYVMNGAGTAQMDRST